MGNGRAVPGRRRGAWAWGVLASALMALLVGVGVSAGGMPGGLDDCAASTDPESPQAIVHEFWTLIDSNYAVFGRRLPGSEWQSVGDAACAQVDANTTDAELYEVLLTMARALDDGHLVINAEELGRDDDGWVNVYPFYEELYQIENVVEANYLDEAEFEYAGNEEFAWGHVDGMGYIGVYAMEGFNRRDTRKSNKRAARRIMRRAIRDLRDAPGIIIDVRANEGGWDDVALEIARAFEGDRTLAWSKQRRNGPGHNDLSAPERYDVKKQRRFAYDGPVVLLTSGGTFSAGETFVLAMRVRDHVTVMGEPTAGFLSDQLSQTLANGWEIDYSGELYTAGDGEIYEGPGIPADMPIAFAPVPLIDEGRDVMLEAAIEFLGQ